MIDQVLDLTRSRIFAVVAGHVIDTAADTKPQGIVFVSCFATLFKPVRIDLCFCTASIFSLKKYYSFFILNLRASEPLTDHSSVIKDNDVNF